YAHGAGSLGHELGGLAEERDGIGDLVLAHGLDGANELSQQRQGQRARALDRNTVGDRVARRGLAARSRTGYPEQLGVWRARGRLDADELDVGTCAAQR